ncbi:MAG: hypothetical protein RLY71_976 [Pseudomonadota bacterium]|jgi:uncharacterized membrane protein YbaN (DUF454 family)
MSHSPDPVISRRVRWHGWLWLLAGWISLALGVIGIFLPLLPTTPFVLLAAACFSRGSERCERWLLDHPRFGPLVRDWRTNRAVPLRAKQLAVLMMSFGSASAWLAMPHFKWLPALCCACVAVWLWRLPTRQPDAAVRVPVASSNSDKVSPPGSL